CLGTVITLFRSHYLLTLAPEMGPLDEVVECIVCICNTGVSVFAEDGFPFGPEIGFFDDPTAVVVVPRPLRVALFKNDGFAVNPEPHRFQSPYMRVINIGEP